MLSCIRGICHFIIVFVLVVSLMCNFLFIKQIAQLKQEVGGLRSPSDLEKLPVDVSKAVETEEPSRIPPIPLPPAPSQPSPASARESGNLSFRYSRLDETGLFCDGETVSGSIVAKVYGIGNRPGNYKYEISPAPVRLNRIFAEYYSDTITVEGVFKIGNIHTITVKAGAILQYDKILANDYSFTVKIPDPAPNATFLTRGLYYPVKIQNGKVTDWELPIAVTNVNSITLILWKQNNRNLDLILDTFSYWYGNEIKDRMMSKIAVKSISLPIVHNVTRKFSLDMGKIFPDLSPGMYGVELSLSPESTDSHESFRNHTNSPIIILSSLGITANMDQDNHFAVCIHDLNTLEPVSDAHVSVITAKRDIIAEGTTNQDGSLLLTAHPSLDLSNNNQPKTILVTKGEDISVIQLEPKCLNSDHEYPNYSQSFKQRYYPFGYTERGIYRMGDTVCIGLFLRERDGAELKAAQAPLEISVTDPKGNSILKRTVTPDSFGFAKLDCPLSPSAFHGYYSVGITCGEDHDSTSFLVSAYEPDKIRVEAAFDKEAYSLDDAPVLSYFGEYYMGGKTHNAMYDLTISLSQTTPPHWKEYAVGLKASSQSSYTVCRLIELKGTSHTLPRFRNLLSNLKESNQKVKDSLLSRPVAVTAQVGCTDIGSQTVTAHTSSVMLPTSCFLGLKHLGAKDHSAQFDCRLLAWDKETKPTLSKETCSFALTLKKCTWDYVLEEGSSINRMVWKQIETDCPINTILTMDAEQVKLELPDLEDGHYLLTAKNGDGLITQISFWHENGEAGSIHSENPNILAVSTNQNQYLPGDSAELSFDALGNGSCFISAGEKALEYQASAKVQKGKNTLKLLVPKSVLTAHYYATVTVVCKQGDNLTRSFALVSLPVKQEAHRMRIAMTAPEKAEPATKLKLKLQCSSQDGKPLPATLHLFAVDEGILALTAYQTPDIFEYFYGKYNTTFQSFDLYAQLYPKLAIKGLEKIGGDGTIDARLARLENLKHKEDAIVLLDTIQVPENGIAEPEIELPDHTGALRIMAIAAGKDAVGSESHLLKMRHKVTVMPKAPLFVSPGDRFQLSYKLINHELNASEGLLKLAIPKELQTEGASSEFGVNVPLGKEYTVELVCQGNAKGAFTIRHDLQIGGKHYTGSCIVNCRTLSQYTTQVENLHLKPGESVELDTVATEWEELKGMELKLTPSPAFAVKDALKWLDNYPYGCLEQTTSTAFPFLCVDKLVTAKLVDNSYSVQAQSKLNSAYYRVLSMRRGSRGFTMWPDSDWIWEEAGLYATHFLFLVDADEMPKALKRDLLEYTEKAWQDSIATAPVNASYALFIQSLKSKGESQCNKILGALKRIPESDDLSRFLLGAALFKAGEATQAAELLNKSLDGKCWLTQGDGLPWFLNADCTRVGMLLSIAMQTVPKHPANTEMAFYLVRKLRKDDHVWGSTRNNAWASMGLAEYAVANPVEDTAFSLVMGNTTRQENLQGPLSIPLDQTGKLTLSDTGKGDLFARLIIKGIPKSLPNNTSAIRLNKRILDADGNPVTSVKPGALLTVSLWSEKAVSIDSFVLLDLLPGGCAIENGSLATRQSSTGDAKEKHEGIRIRHQEKHDDRFLLMGAMNGDKPFAITYKIRAITPGTFAIPPVHLEDMYNLDLQGTFVPEEKLEVK